MPMTPWWSMGTIGGKLQRDLLLWCWAFNLIELFVVFVWGFFFFLCFSSREYFLNLWLWVWYIYIYIYHQIYTVKINWSNSLKYFSKKIKRKSKKESRESSFPSFPGHQPFPICYGTLTISSKWTPLRKAPKPTLAVAALSNFSFLIVILISNLFVPHFSLLD